MRLVAEYEAWLCTPNSESHERRLEIYALAFVFSLLFILLGDLGIDVSDPAQWYAAATFFAYIMLIGMVLGALCIFCFVIEFLCLAITLRRHKE